jgi:hypothetical protein
MAKQGAVKEKQTVEKQGSLKNALADAIGKPAEAPKAESKPEMPPSEHHSAFEVPEHILKDLFKKDL